MLESSQLNILHTESSIGWGGQEIRILTEMQAFLDAGHKVTLMAPENAPILQDAIKRGFCVVKANIGRKNLTGLMQMRKFLAQNKFDVINTHSSTDSWLVALASIGLDTNIVRTRHVSTAINNKFATKWLYQNATKHIVITGEALRQRLINDNGYDANMITSVPTGIDLNHYKPLNQEECRQKLGIQNRPTIGILATLRDWKGHDYLLEAFSKIHIEHPKWQLLIVGDGPRMSHLKNKIDELGLQNDVFLVGNQSNVPEWLACFDIFTLPSFGEEGVPQSIMQAMSCGLPVVSTTVGAIREVVIEYEVTQTGIIIEPKDAKKLENALIKLIEDEALRNRLSANAIKIANERFGVAKMQKAMQDVFTSVLQAKN